MIVKVLYSLSNNCSTNQSNDKKLSSNLYLSKSPSSKIPNFNLRVIKISKPNESRPQLYGFVSLSKCLSMAILHSPELFQLDKLPTLLGETQDSALKNRVIDYSVYNRDILELDQPLVGNGSLKQLLQSNNINNNSGRPVNIDDAVSENYDPIIVGSILKKPSFFMDDGDCDDEDEDDGNAHDVNEDVSQPNEIITEENPMKYLENNIYSLEIRLEFMKFIRNFNPKMDKMERNSNSNTNDNNSNNTKKEFAVPIRKTNSKKAPKAVRTLSLPIFNPNFVQFPRANGMAINIHGPKTFGNQAATMMASPVMNNLASGEMKPTINASKTVKMGNSSSSSSLASSKKKKKSNGLLLKRKLVKQAEDFSDLPISPMCINCKTDKAVPWSWFRNETMEGLICKDCDEYYKRYDKMKPIKRTTTNNYIAEPKTNAKTKSKKRKVNSHDNDDKKKPISNPANINSRNNSSVVNPNPNILPHQGPPFSIAHSLSINRELIIQLKKKSQGPSSPVVDQKTPQDTTRFNKQIQQKSNQKKPIQFIHHKIPSEPLIIINTPAKKIPKHFNINSPDHMNKSPNSKWLSNMLKSIGTESPQPFDFHDQTIDILLSESQSDHLKHDSEPPKNHFHKFSNITRTLKEIESESNNNENDNDNNGEKDQKNKNDNHNKGNNNSGNNNDFHKMFNFGQISNDSGKHHHSSDDSNLGLLHDGEDDLYSTNKNSSSIPSSPIEAMSLPSKKQLLILHEELSQPSQ